MNDVIYRVTGGDAHRVKNRAEFADYGVHIYTITREFPTMYWVEKDEKKFQIHKGHDTNTPNSTYVRDLDDAFDLVATKIGRAKQSISKSSKDVLHWQPTIEWGEEYLFHAKFRAETFSIQQFRIVGKTKRAWKIDTRKLREKPIRNSAGKIVDVKNVPVGRSYIYPHVPLPHNPIVPLEEWVDADLLAVQAGVKKYARTRLRYLSLRAKELEALRNEYRKRLK